MDYILSFWYFFSLHISTKRTEGAQATDATTASEQQQSKRNPKINSHIPLTFSKNALFIIKNATKRNILLQINA